MDYSKAKTISANHNERNDCSVKAVAIACDVPYKVAHKAFAKVGRINRKGVSLSQIDNAIKSLGFKWEAVPHSAKTMTTLDKDVAVQSGHYIANVRGHVAAVVNGKVEDWSEGRRNRLLTVFKVTPNATRRERKQMMKELF